MKKTCIFAKSSFVVMSVSVIGIGFTRWLLNSIFSLVVLDVEFIFSSILKQELNYKQHQMSYDYIDYRGPDFDGCTNCTDLVKGGGDCLSLSRSSCI